jgi:ankyrin repeat protein
VFVCSGAGVTDKNSDGKTALEVAKLNEHEDIVKLLQEKEGDAFL